MNEETKDKKDKTIVETKIVPQNKRVIKEQVVCHLIDVNFPMDVAHMITDYAYWIPGDEILCATMTTGLTDKITLLQHQLDETKRHLILINAGVLLNQFLSFLSKSTVDQMLIEIEEIVLLRD
jgi:hypothetical protein